jgi:hypothetical protein
LSLIRRPGRHADDAHVPDHTAYLAWAGTNPWLLRLTLSDPATLLGLDLDALARGDRAAVLAGAPGAETAEPILLVCTNGRRDVCCAVRGRPVALDAAEDHPGQVWEASHTGGHRFAPTGVLLPHGATLARLDADQCGDVLRQAGEGRLPVGVLGPRHDRGRSALTAPEQAAESHVRHESGITDLGALRVSITEDESVYAVQHRDGRHWRVALGRREHPDLPESCGKVPVHVSDWTGRTLD